MASLAARRAKPGFSRIAFEVILHLEGTRRQHVAQVGSALVEQDGRDRIPKRMCGNDRHSRTLAGEFDPSVERLVAKASAVTARKDQRRSREVHSPSPQPHALHTSKNANHSSSESDNSFLSGTSRKEPPLS